MAQKVAKSREMGQNCQAPYFGAAERVEGLGDRQLKNGRRGFGSKYAGLGSKRLELCKLPHCATAVTVVVARCGGVVAGGGRRISAHDFVTTNGRRTGNFSPVLRKKINRISLGYITQMSS